MDRRGFLRGFVGAVATAAVAEALQPARTIFLPPRGGWWSDTDFRGADARQIQEDIERCFQQMLRRSQEPIYYTDAGIEKLAAAVPQFLTNYVDPKVIEILVSPMAYKLITE